MGRYLNIINNEINDMEIPILFLFTPFTGPFMIGLSLYLTYSYYGNVSFISAGIILLYLPVSFALAKKKETFRANKNKATDQRIELTTELLENIRLIKMYSWESKFFDLIVKERQKETAETLHVLEYEVFNYSISEFVVPFALVLVLGAYSVFGDNYITAEKIYSSSFILNITRLYASYFLGINNFNS